MKKLAKRCESVPRSAIRQMVEKSYGIEDAISFAFGQPDFETPKRIIDVGIKALQDAETFYTPNAGMDELRIAVAGDMEKRGMHYEKGNVIVTVGAMESLALSMLALLDDGDEMIIQDPCFVNYYGMIGSEGAVPVPVRSKEENEFMLDPGDVRAAISERTKALLINFPTNPTGAVASAENLKALADIAIEHDLYVISDEMYRKLIYTEDEFISIAQFPGMKERTLIIDGCSKAYAMTGWRVGYTIGPEKIIANMTKMQENVASCVFAPVQRAAVDAITGDQGVVDDMVRKYKSRRDLMVKGLNEMMHGKITALMPKGAFYIFANIKNTGLSSEEFSNRLMDEKHVVTVPGSGFGENGEGFVRISYAISEDEIKTGLRRIQEFVESL